MVRRFVVDIRPVRRDFGRGYNFRLKSLRQGLIVGGMSISGGIGVWWEVLVFGGRYWCLVGGIGGR